MAGGNGLVACCPWLSLGQLRKRLHSTRLSPSGLPAAGGCALSAAAGFPGLLAAVSVLPGEQLVLSWHGDCRLMCMHTGASMGWLGRLVSRGSCSRCGKALVHALTPLQGEARHVLLVSTRCCCPSCQWMRRLGIRASVVAACLVFIARARCVYWFGGVQALPCSVGRGGPGSSQSLHGCNTP